MKLKSCTNNVIFAILFLILVISLTAVSAMNSKEFESASAAPASDAALTYDQAKAQMASVKAEYDQIMQQAKIAEADVAKTSEQAFAVQDEYLESQQEYIDMVVFGYKNSTSFSLTSSLMNAGNINDLLKNIDYANCVIDYQRQIAAERKSKKNSFDNILAELNKKSDSLKAQLAAADAKMQETQKILDRAAANLNAEQIDELKAASGGQGGEDPKPTPSPTPTPTPTPDPDPGPTPSWNTGIASAYGGSSDPHTPNPGRTATGEICDDWSKGVAIPMSWPNYRSYFRHAIQISYNGMTVLARINDCGNMGGGSRSLDLQPGVFKAFGFNTCQAWGLRRVSYNII